MDKNKSGYRNGEETRRKILECISSYLKEHGYPPTVREIRDAVGLSSTCTVKHHLDTLIKEGKLETDQPGSSRAIRVSGYEFVKRENHLAN